MKAQFARELKMMIENEVKIQRAELQQLSKLEIKTRKQMERELDTEIAI